MDGNHVAGYKHNGGICGGCRRVLCGCHYSRTLERGITPFHVLLDNIRLRPVEASERTCDRITNILNSSVQVS